MADDHRWVDWYYSESDPGSFTHPIAHPDSPAGGPGPGRFRRPGPVTNTWPSMWSAPHPDSPAGRHFSWHLEFPLIVFERRVRAVYDALTTAPRYVPQAIVEATGLELHAMVAGIIPGLLLCIGVLAASTAVGAAAGAAIGALAFGTLAAPGAVVGAEAGFEAGTTLLGYLGLAFLVAYIGKSLWQAAGVAAEGVKIAWRSVDDQGPRSWHIERAANRLAFAVGLVFRGVLQGIVAFLLAKGTAAAASRVPELVNGLRGSKLGAGFAEWVEGNWKALIDNPRLKGDFHRSGMGASGGGVSAGAGKEGRAAAASAGAGGSAATVAEDAPKPSAAKPPKPKLAEKAAAATKEPSLPAPAAPTKLAAALRDAPSGSAERAALADEFAKISTHVKEPANRVVLGKWSEGGGYIAEAQKNGGVWYETPEGTYQVMGKEAAWETNEAFLKQQMATGKPVEFTGMSEDEVASKLADLSASGQPIESAPARIREFVFMQNNAPNYGYVQQGMSFVKTP